MILAENGSLGIETYQRRRKDIDLVVLDMTMPVMDGRACFTRLKELDPDVRVILEQIRDFIQSSLGSLWHSPTRLGNWGAPTGQDRDRSVETRLQERPGPVPMPQNQRAEWPENRQIYIFLLCLVHENDTRD